MVGSRSTTSLWRRLSPRHLLLLVPWVGLGIAASAPIRDNSFLWHVRAGTVQLDLGQVLTSDPFSFTMQGAPWRTQSWLAELGYGTLERWMGGLGWVPIMQLLVGSVTTVAVGVAVYRRSRSLLATGVGLGAFTWLSIAFQVQRPALLSFMLLATLVLLLEGRVLWAIPMIVWVWAAIHGSWIIGVGLVVLWALGGRLGARPALRTVFVSLMLASLTAHGLGVWEILWRFLRNRDALSLMSEWARPDLLSIPVVPFVAIAAVLLLALASGRLQSRDLWIVGPFLLFGLLATRNLLLAAIVLLPAAASGVGVGEGAESIPGSKSSRLLNLSIGLVLLAVPLLVVGMQPMRLDKGRFPIDAAEHLGTGTLWHDDVAGGYLIYRVWPRQSVFIDDRAELYGANMMRTFIETRQVAAVWNADFARYGISQVVVRRDDRLAEVLDEIGFHISYQDEVWTLWERTR